jgi:hypothetical protein
MELIVEITDIGRERDALMRRIARQLPNKQWDVFSRSILNIVPWNTNGRTTHAIGPYDTSSGCSPERQTLKLLTVLWFFSPRGEVISTRYRWK